MKLAVLPQRLRAELWLSAEKVDDVPSVEERIRGKDAKIAACALLNFSDPDHAQAAARAAGDMVPAGSVIGTYRLIGALDHQDIQT